MVKFAFGVGIGFCLAGSFFIHSLNDRSLDAGKAYQRGYDAGIAHARQFESEAAAGGVCFLASLSCGGKK
jgi:hypothetical protein